MNSAVNFIQGTQVEVNAEDIARLSPLAFRHINMLGRYDFELSDAILQGKMRPLRDLSQIGQFEDFDE